MTNQTVLANNQIRCRQVRLVDESGSHVMDTDRAQQRADQAGLDLIMINQSATPPVCKILDLNKYQYDLKQKEKAQAQSQRESKIVVKEVQFKLNIDQHDFATKCNKIVNFIAKGNQVKVIVQFRGRERFNPILGYELAQRVINEVGNVDTNSIPQLNGNRIITILKGQKDGTQSTK